jgi:hypothetical protein
LAFFYHLIKTAENILQPGKLMTSLQFMYIAVALPVADSTAYDLKNLAQKYGFQRQSLS